MQRFARTVTVVLAAAGAHALLGADLDRDFSGRWIYDAAGSNTRSIAAPQERAFAVTRQGDSMQCSASRPDGSALQWSYALDGSETRYRWGEESRSSQVKWEGRALLVNTIVSGPHNYSINDRWTLSADRVVLTIGRQTVQGSSESEGVLRYRREEAGVSSGNATSTLVTGPPAGASPNEIIVRAGTRIPLSLRNAIDTKHSHEGDRVYLDTQYPIVVNNRIVIPRGSYVSGTLTTVRPAGVVKGKGELYIRFDSLILPNGVTRDFRSRLASADSGHGKVDRQEGTITGERDKSGEAKTTAEGAGIGAGVGGLAGAAAGHPLAGAGIGGAAGAAAGLASVLLRHRPDASLPRGTTVEMLLDRDLAYLPSELSSH